MTEMQKLLDEHTEITLPAVGDIVEGLVISALNNEVHIDIKGIATGVVRGPELIDESGMYENLKIGEEVSATVLELENEMGELELSFREAGHKKAWDELERLFKESEKIQGQVIDANKGGLIVKFKNVTGFLPVSQLTVERYPRVEGANRTKILAKLQEFIGQSFDLVIIDVDEGERKLIFSEKAAKAEEQKEMLEAFKIGDTVKGTVTGVVDFGAFVQFGEGLEGLVHISELAWQRIDNPKDVINVNDEVESQIISIENGKISLSIRRLQQDPWAKVAERYNVGDIVEGTVLKLNPFGAFVELDKDIHGLAHISELSWKKIQAPDDVLTSGEVRKFKIVSIEPGEHRLGLSVKQMTERPGGEKKAEADKSESADKDGQKGPAEEKKTGAPATEEKTEDKPADEATEKKEATPAAEAEEKPEAEAEEPKEEDKTEETTA